MLFQGFCNFRHISLGFCVTVFQGFHLRRLFFEETIDTLNIAFEKLLDSIFRDTAWDVSTDISVLHTVLAQEGLTEDDFEKMKQNAEVK